MPLLRLLDRDCCVASGWCLSVMVHLVRFQYGVVVRCHPYRPDAQQDHLMQTEYEQG